MTVVDNPSTNTAGEVQLERAGGSWLLTLARPEAHNSITATMYESLTTHVARVASIRDRRPLVIRGSGGLAFASGTDIAYMQTLDTPQHAVEYERRLTQILNDIEDLDAPTIAVIEGHCYGAGMLLAAACDLRIAAAGSRFGVPIAKTVGNCLSVESVRLLIDRLGTSRVLDMLLRARTFDTMEMHTSGFLNEVVESSTIDDRVRDLVRGLSTSAPLTVWAAKESARRLRRQTAVDDRDILEKIYGSQDFAAGSQAFLRRQRAAWSGD